MVMAVVVAGGFSVASAAVPGQIDLQRPAEGKFVLDEADLITPEDEAAIRKTAEALLRDKAAPIIVVTIDSMASHGGEGLRIETFATLLFDQWGIGPAEVNGASWNYGILLLVSRDDRKARIELGGGWRRDKDDVAREIMDDRIVPQFKKGEFSKGILDGVTALDHMARDLSLPQRPHTTGEYLIGIGVIALIVFTVVSLIRRGTSGWGWLLWAGVFSLLGFLLYNFLNSSGHSDGGGYSGGSFGGGSSGGGGASGSW